MPTISTPSPHTFRHPIDGVAGMAVAYDGTIQPVFAYGGCQVIVARETGGDVTLVDLATARIMVVPVKRSVTEATLVVPKSIDGDCPAVAAGAPPSRRACCTSLPLGCEAAWS